MALLFLWLLWLPLPFGSNVAEARLPLISVPLLCFAAATFLRLRATRNRQKPLELTTAGIFWGYGAIAFLLVGAIQLVPLPAGLHRLVEPQSFSLWQEADALARLGGVPVDASHPLTLDPAASRIEWLRLGGMLAAFLATALLVRTHASRMALAVVLCSAAAFEALYGVREAALQRYAIWGWVNRLVHNRVTGTFVNPNHFAHYLAIVLPLTFFLLAVAWRNAGREPMSIVTRVGRMLESSPWTVGFALLGALTSTLGLLLAQSRGGLVALTAGVLAVASMLPGRRVLRLFSALSAGTLLMFALILLLSPGRTVERFKPSEEERQTFVGRKVGINTAVRLWQRFPLIGTGLGTFPQVGSMEQREDLTKLYRHAHNDYLELAATSGSLGAVVAMVTLLAGYGALLILTFGAGSGALTFRRRAWQAVALTSLTIAMIHALIDFNFFIPANPATLAVILGAAVASVDHDTRTRR
jgi:putative inorganic carbon (hco3(-)) transporter